MVAAMTFAPLAVGQSALLASPEGDGRGWWAGAPTAAMVGGVVHVAYRLRAPQPRRGYALRLARLRADSTLDDIAEIRASDLRTPSVERGCLAADGASLLLYISYVDPTDGRWRIDLLEAARPDALDARARRAALTAAATGTEGVKDPVVVRDGSRWLMFASVAADPVAAAHHAGGDVFASGATRSATGLATSTDGRLWRWEGTVLSPDGRGWDAFETRISTVYRVGPRGRAVWVALYDGIARVAENYEERTGIATSADLKTWTRHTTRAPAIGARYCEVLRANDRTLLFAEVPREDGAHELRVAQVIVAVETDRMGGR